VVAAESATHSGACGHVRKAEAVDKLYGELSDMLEQLGFSTEA
jgi:hypothetical protein